MASVRLIMKEKRVYKKRQSNFWIGNHFDGLESFTWIWSKEWSHTHFDCHKLIHWGRQVNCKMDNNAQFASHIEAFKVHTHTHSKQTHRIIKNKSNNLLSCCSCFANKRFNFSHFIYRNMFIVHSFMTWNVEERAQPKRDNVPPSWLE